MRIYAEASVDHEIRVRCSVEGCVLKHPPRTHRPSSDQTGFPRSGFHDGFFFQLILQESIILSILGFVAGSIIATVVYALTRAASDMPIQHTSLRLILIFLLTVFMCAVAGILATRKLRAAKPAKLF